MALLQMVVFYICNYWLVIKLLCLTSLYNFGDYKNQGLGKTAKVEAIIDGSEWKWPIDPSLVWLELRRDTPTDF